MKKAELNNQIIEKATEFGACAAGIADVEALKKSPSHLIYGKTGDYKSLLNGQGPEYPVEVAWPEDAKSSIVVAVDHPEDKPELDWWQEIGRASCRERV